ncbi:MAG: hypothetical protein HY341_02610 [Candidatus Kerfeldbacteria bacterium]|nr:hypothetical protein [Candidatus Kerfeldbacteria bacterium]
METPQPDLTPSHELPQGNVPKALPVKKKHHRLRWTLIILFIIFVVLPILALGYSGLYQIPVVSAIFGTNKPIDLGVHPTAADLAKAEADNPTEIKAEPGTFQWSRAKTFTGEVPIDDENTSAEVTAFIQKYHGNSGYVRDIQVRYREGGMEISGFIVPMVKAPAYVNVDVVRVSEKTVSLNLRSAKLGRLTVPEQYYDDIEREATRLVNQEIAKVNGFSMDEVRYGNGTAYFKGTMPKTADVSGPAESVESLLK